MKPKHKKTHLFYAKGLFSDLNNFDELESRIGELPIVERGDAFEVFAEAYFATQSLHQVEEVWPEGELTQSIRNLLSLPSTDMGIDGVFKTHEGEYHAYQVKYRANRLGLSWDELSTFMGLSDKSDKRILFTNSSDLSSVMNARTDFYSIKGNDLDRLDYSAFKAIESWFKSGLIVREKKTPWPHQSEAIDNIIQELNVNDRATAIMACGTGKTLVALWVAEKKDAQTILVLLPSLALVRQTLHDWSKENNWDVFNYLCVCSDATVIKGIDETVFPQHDLDFPVTTKKEGVEQFLKNQKFSRKVIFSTYQSCQIVAEAIPYGFSFDLAIFDEAHKTASRKGANFAFALQNNNLFIRKRLFLTATPRHYNVNKKDKEGDQRLVYSMDDEIIYGRISHQLSFRAAVKKGLICDYKVIISAVTSEQVNRELLKRGEVIVDGDVIKAQRVANILALQKAIEKYGVKKIFSFHNSVNSAKSFTSSKNEGVGAYLEEFVSLHINGKMTTSIRYNFLREFKQSNNAIVSNARCLTEGVNVPTVDMVAFISPKKSKVDIVQATGRAMRKSPGKKLGYILIPLFIQLAEDENFEEALEKTKFQTVWDVLQAMQEQDERLVESIAKVREGCGGTLGFNDNRLMENVEVLGPELFLDELRSSITIRIVDKLGSTWDERFGELMRFKEEHGHCNVPAISHENPSLGVWVSTQRYVFSKKNLLKKRITRLNELGFIWCRFNTIWERQFVELCKYKKTNQNCNVPEGYFKDPSLARWVQTQRYLHRKKDCRLSENRIERLNQVGFDWDPRDYDYLWNQKIKELCLFMKLNGHCNVPLGYKKNKSLGFWVSNIRMLYRQRDSRLNENRIKQLNELKFIWNPLINSWENGFSLLVAFKEKNSSCNVQQKDKQNKKLAIWIGTQRRNYRSDKLSIDRMKRLNVIGFCWNARDDLWNKRLQSLREYKCINGHCNVPKRYSGNLSLGVWVRTQRYLYNTKNKRLTFERIKMLNKIGFF